MITPHSNNSSRLLLIIYQRDICPHKRPCVSAKHVPCPAYRTSLDLVIWTLMKSQSIGINCSALLFHKSILSRVLERVDFRMFETSGKRLSREEQVSVIISPVSRRRRSILRPFMREAASHPGRGSLKRLPKNTTMNKE